LGTALAGKGRGTIKTLGGTRLSPIAQALKEQIERERSAAREDERSRHRLEYPNIVMGTPGTFAAFGPPGENDTASGSVSGDGSAADAVWETRMVRPAMERYLNSALIRFGRFWRHCLCLFFRFDCWHISSLRQRPYARDIIDYLNALPPERRTNALEIGCGLGDIIRNIDFKERAGLDADDRVLGAASFLSWFKGRKTSFISFIFPDSSLSGRYDVIIMVNWVHHVRPDVLKQKIEDYARNNLTKGAMIVIDTVHDREYKYNHDITALTADFECRIFTLGPYESGREVHVITPSIQ